MENAEIRGVLEKWWTAAERDQAAFEAEPVGELFPSFDPPRGHDYRHAGEIVALIGDKMSPNRLAAMLLKVARGAVVSDGFVVVAELDSHTKSQIYKLRRRAEPFGQE